MDFADPVLPGKDGTQRTHRLVLGILVAWILAQSARMMWQPPVADEVDFLVAALHWPAQAGRVPHPPGLVHVLRLLFAIFGVHAWVARLPGLVSALVTLAMIPALTRLLAGDPRRSARATLFALLLFGLAPLAVQDAMLVDIDNTVMAPILAALFLLWYRARPWGALRATLTLGLAIACALWFKLPPPLFLMGALVLAELLRGSRPRAAVGAAATVLGALVFIATLALHDHWTGYSNAAMAGTFRKLAWLANVRAMLVRAPQNAGVLALWVGLPWMALVAMAIARAGSAPEPARLASRAASLFVAGTLIFYTFTLLVAYGYPKYDAVALPFMAALAGTLVAGQTEGAPGGVPWAAAGAAAVAQLVVGDFFRAMYRVSVHTNVDQLAARLETTAHAVVLAAVPPLAGVGAALALGVRARRIGPALVYGLAFGGIGAGAAWLTLQAGAPYVTRYSYGADPRQLLAASDTVQAHTTTADRVLAPKDILYHSGREGRFVSDLVWSDVAPDSLLGALDQHRFAALAWTIREETRGQRVIDDPRVRSRLAAQFTRRTVGDWIVWIPAHRP